MVLHGLGEVMWGSEGEEEKEKEDEGEAILSYQPIMEVWKIHHQQLVQGPSQTWVATNTKSQNKWLYMM